VSSCIVVRAAVVAAVAWYDETADEIGSLGRLEIGGVAAVAKYGDGPLVCASIDIGVRGAAVAAVA
jgi:hypothetical protein